MGLVCSDHQQAMAERTSLSSMLAKSQDDLPPKRMKDSYLEVHLPLGSEPRLREKYLTFHNTVRYTHALTSVPTSTRTVSPLPRCFFPFRFGRILEDLDSLAGCFYTGDLRRPNRKFSTLMPVVPVLPPQSSSATPTPLTRC